MKKPLISFSNKALSNLCLSGCVCLSMIFSSGCGTNQQTDQGQALAVYGDHTLYQLEVDYFLPDSLSTEDSARLTKQYIDQWLRGHVVKGAAAQAIPDLEQRVDYLMRAYERSVIEHQYATYLLETNAAALSVSEAETEAYYQENEDKFKSRATFFQYFYVKTNLPNQYKVVNLIRSDDPEKIEELIRWSQENATEYKLDSSYVSETEIERISEGYYYGNIKKASLNTPYAYAHTESDTTRYDFFRLLAVIEPGDLLPLSMCRERIAQVLRNQRKESLIKKEIHDLVKQAEAANKAETLE
jgi:hypothetical protein